MRTLLPCFKSLLCLGLLASSGLFASEVAPSAAEAKPLPVGAKAPTPVVKTPDGADYSLSEAFQRRTTLVIVFRGGWCPFCSKHLSELAGIEEQLKASGVQILALSTDQPSTLAAFAQQKKLGYQLLSDRDMKFSGPLGLAFRVPEETAAKYAERKIDLPPIPGDAAHRWLPVPAAYLISTDGTIRFAYSDPNFKERLSTERLLAAVKAALP